MNKRSAIVVLLTVIAALLTVNIVVMGSRSAEAQGAKGDGEPYVAKYVPFSSSGYSRVWSDGQIDLWHLRKGEECEPLFGEVIIGSAGHPFDVVDAAYDGHGYIVEYSDGRVDQVWADGDRRCTIAGEGGPPFCMGDVDRSGETDFDDLLFVLTDWGPCEG